MSREGLEVIITEDGRQNEHVAVANASKYLFRGADYDSPIRTRSPDVIDVNVYGGEDGRDYGIGITFTLDIDDDDELRRLMNGFTNMVHVETVERVSVEAL